MGKFMRKAKTKGGEVAVMDLSLGVRTRAKTLALQRQARLTMSRTRTRVQPPPSASPPGSGGYLQLRSRRLEKPSVVVNDSKRQKHGHDKDSQKSKPNCNLTARRVGVSPAESGFHGLNQKEEMHGENKEEEIQGVNSNSSNSNNGIKDLSVEVSFAENVLDIEGRERNNRESTPRSLIRDAESIRTPCSTTRPTSSTETNMRSNKSPGRHIPTATEFDEFFARHNKEQIIKFIEKYNFDPVNDMPLNGRYVWEKLDP